VISPSETAPTTVDVVARQLATNPELLYQRAAMFDDMEQRLGDITDGFRGVLRQVEEGWVRYEDGGAPPALGAVSAHILSVLRELQSADCGSLLRQAGDSLAQAQAQIHDLQLQRMQDPAVAAGSVPVGPNSFDELARLVLQRVSEDFVEVGTNLPDLPERTAAGSQLTPGTAGPAPMMSLASASYLADDEPPLSRSRPPDVPGAAGSLSGPPSLSASAFDPSSPASPPGGQPMMPMMPMGMGMGMGMGGAQPGARERHTDSQATADPDAWREPDDGWEVLGRRPPPRPPHPQREAIDAINELMRNRELSLGRGGKNV
jgi:hypothetical protein